MDTTEKDDTELKRFLNFIASAGGRASRTQLPLVTRSQDVARQKARRLGLATYGGSPSAWSLTEAGRKFLEAST